jgi:penicillin-binding protein 1A
MGFDDFSSLGHKETGGRAALGMWVHFMREALDGEPEALPLEPPGLLHVRINRYSGYLTGAYDPDAIMETVRQEYEAMLLGPDMSPYHGPEPLVEMEWTTDPEPYGIHRPVRPTKPAQDSVLERLF